MPESHLLNTDGWECTYQPHERGQAPWTVSRIFTGFFYYCNQCHQGWTANWAWHCCYWWQFRTPASWTLLSGTINTANSRYNLYHIKCSFNADLKAETLWALNFVVKNYSFMRCKGVSEIFVLCFQIVRLQSSFTVESRKQIILPAKPAVWQREEDERLCSAIWWKS